MTGHNADDDRTRSYHSVSAGTAISHYKILSRIGAGGMGEVYLAEDTRLDRKVALKFLSDRLSSDDSCRARFQREAQAAAALNHDNIVTIHEVSEFNSRPYFSMEYLQGQSLRDLLRQRSLDLREALDIFLGICRGVAEAHRAGIIHRDIKPSNVVIDSRGRPKLVDFGLASVKTIEGITREGSFVGTVGYLSPEAIKGSQADVRSDIFSLGVLLYELVTGHHPFMRSTEEATMYAIVHEDPPRTSELRSAISRDLQTIIHRCLEKNPDKRYQSADDLTSDLTPVRESFGRRKSDQHEAGAGRSIPRGPLLIGGAAVLGFLLMLLILTPGTRNWISSFFTSEAGLGQQRLAVLPFVDIGTEGPGKAFCDGLSETLASKLTQLEQFSNSLSVISISDVKERSITSAREARNALGANLVIAGSFQSFGPTMRLTLNMIDTKSEQQLQSRILDYASTNLVALQDSAVIEVTDMLDVSLPGQGRDVIRAGRTDKSVAYGDYLEGRGHLQQAGVIPEIDSAISHFKEALEQDPDYGLALSGLGEAYWERYLLDTDPQSEEMAIYYARRAVEVSDDLAPAYNTIGTIYTESGRYDEAVVQFERTLAIDSENRDAFKGLASALEYLQKYDSAETVYRAAIAVDPENANSWIDLGLFLRRRGRFAEASAHVDSAVEAGPRGYVAFNNLGALYFNLDQAEKARTLWKRSLEIEPNYGALSNLGAVDYQSGNFAEAADRYREAIELNDRDYGPWLNLGSALSEIPERQDEMREVLETGIELAEKQRAINPQDAELHGNLADAYALLGHEDQAATLIQEAVNLDPGNLQVRLVAATVYEEIGRREEAITQLVRAVHMGLPIAYAETIRDFNGILADERFRLAVEAPPAADTDSI